MPDKAVTITANWKKKSSGGSVFFWDLKFDTNGGSKIDTVGVEFVKILFVDFLN